MAHEMYRLIPDAAIKYSATAITQTVIANVLVPVCLEGHPSGPPCLLEPSQVPTLSRNFQLRGSLIILA